MDRGCLVGTGYRQKTFASQQCVQRHVSKGEGIPCMVFRLLARLIIAGSDCKLPVVVWTLVACG